VKCESAAAAIAIGSLRVEPGGLVDHRANGRFRCNRVVRLVSNEDRSPPLRESPRTLADRLNATPQAVIRPP
jgi:hypothetical protein